MGATELFWLSASEIREGLRRRDFSCLEVVNAHLDRIAAVDPKIEAYITVLGDAAIGRAKELDGDLAAGRERGILHGVPYSLKDVFQTRGVRTTAGSSILSEWIPDETATVVNQLDKAGAVLLGKVNSHEFAYGVSTQNVHGHTKNPWDLSRIPGGSSGGSGAAVAAGLCSFSLGTDTAGSIRLPAAFSGINGLKPTYGRVSCHGVVAQSFSADHTGPLARSVADLALVLRAIAGHDPLDPETRPEPAEDYGAGIDEGIKGFKVGVPSELFEIGLQPDVERAFSEAERVLGDLGCDVREISIPLLQEATEINMAVIMSETTARHDEWAKGWFSCYRIVYGEDVQRLLDLGRRITGPEFVLASRKRQRLKGEIENVFRGGINLLLTPTVPFAAPRVDDRSVRLGDKDVDVLGGAIHFVCAFSLAGLPALALPAGFDKDGLPLSIQIIGRAFDEASVLRAGYAFEKITDWQRRPPGF